MVDYSAGPKRDGQRYCSEWCGGGCTWAEYELALARATECANALGKGWKARASENLGWTSRVWKGDVEVSLPSVGHARYFASIAGKGILGTGDTARAALEDMRDAMMVKVDRAQKLFELADGALNEAGPINKTAIADMVGRDIVMDD